MSFSFEGYFCPLGAITTQQNPCYPGTYGTRQGYNDASECEPCPESYYCDFGSTLFSKYINIGLDAKKKPDFDASE